MSQKLRSLFSKGGLVDIGKHVKSYLSGDCSLLTKDTKGHPYRACRPPFRYISKDGKDKVQDCARECWDNLHEWLPPLLENLPTILQITVEGTSDTIDLLQTVKTPAFFHYYRHAIYTADINEERYGKSPVNAKEVTKQLQEYFMKKVDDLSVKTRHGIFLQSSSSWAFSMIIST